MNVKWVRFHQTSFSLPWFTLNDRMFVTIYLDVFFSYFLIENNVFDETTPLCYKANLISLSCLNDHNPGIHLPELKLRFNFYFVWKKRNLL